MEIIFDVECDGLLREATKIHCLCYYDVNTHQSKSLTNYEEIKKLLKQDNLTLIGHNICAYDVPVLEKILGISIPAKKIDTLPLSWYLYYDRNKHGLEQWGEEFGVQKPKIADWYNLSQEEYIHRCEEDVKINTKLWNKQRKQLNALYDNDEIQWKRLVSYLSFKMDCIREQEEVGIKLDVEKCKSVLEKLEEEKALKVEDLKEVMPQRAIKKTKEYKDAIMGADGNISQPGELFFETTVPVKQIDKLEKIVRYEEGKPTSSQQIKDWLYSLGWVPENIQQKRNKETGEIKSIPQIKSKENDGTVCPSVKRLFQKEPKLRILEGLAVLSHRIGILKAFLKDQVDGILYASAVGITNTMRMRHKVIVNLPGLGKKYAEEIRSCLIPYEGYILCGSDLSNIEDRMKRHFIYQYDPEYVREMSVPGFDAHLDIGLRANIITPEDVEFYKWYEKQKEVEGWKPTTEQKERFADIKARRHKSKTTNFSATYKVGAAKLAHELNIKLREAKSILDAYWERNRAIKQVEDACEVKELYNQKWQKNPINGFWYSLRNDKDKFSTLNQGSAAYVFDIWLTNVRKAGLKIGCQYHDELICNVLPEDKEKTTKILMEGIDKINERFKFNVELGCSADYGSTYWDIH